MKMLQKKGHHSGFTIIEVMIVMAIGALILVIALVAIPQLQRTQRNTARKDIIGRISTELVSYQGNNGGKIPTDVTGITGFTTRYLSGIASNIQDPKTGTAVSVAYYSGAAPTVGSAFPAPAAGTASYLNGYVCDGENAATGSARNYALWYALEGGAIFCVDNK